MNLQVGSGKIRIPGFTNIDIEPSHEPDICGDVLTMDFENVDVIYSAHCLEHLEVSDCQKAFSLFFKWLKPSGVLRFSVPSLELAVNAYHTGSDLKFLYGVDFKGYYLYDTPCERLNFFMKEWEHKLIYDFSQLRTMLFNAGFTKIERKEANQSAIPNFNNDRFISESLYVECIK